ncbi:MAG: hypothetical protein JWQ73_3838 [Variovorax sp.]|jgi:hypothetical protein|nr:hypothetical protein [Variovorax sp.]
MGALVTIGVVAFAAASHFARPPLERPVPKVNVQTADAAGPVRPQLIASRASDRYEYLADVLRQLESHPQATCRNEVAGPLGMQEELAQASALDKQGKSQDAAVVLTAVEKQLDAKFKMECLKVG